MNKIRIFQEPDGKWHWCLDGTDYLDARGIGYTTKRQAQAAAKQALAEAKQRDISGV